MIAKKGQNMEMLKDLHEICETLSHELQTANQKIRSAGGKMTGSDLDYIDKLTHAIKSIKTTIAMVEAEDGASGRYMPHYGYSYGDGYDHDMSYARHRDGMGRYTSRRGTSYSDGMVDELRALMEDAPDEATKKEFRRFISKIESM